MAGRWPLGLASSSNREVIELFMQSSGLGDRFKAWVSSEEVGRGKPAPDVFEEAARRLGVEPSAAAAVEDSHNGILAARAAGMTVLAVPNHEFPPGPEALQQADAVLDGLDELTPEAVERAADGLIGPIYKRTMAELASGTTFAGHRIEEVAGRGGMGVVYRATQLALDRTVALKVIAPGLIEDDAMRKRFVRESKVAASIDHPNVIPIYYAGEEDGVAYIAMRYVAGDDLRSLVRREGRLEPRRAARLIVAGRRGARRRARRRPRAPRRQARQRPARPRGARLPDRLRAHQARAVGRRRDEARPLGRHARLRRARADPRRARRRAGRRLRARLRPLLRAHRPTCRSSARATRRGCGRTCPRTRRSRASACRACPPSFDEVVERAMAKSPDERFPSAGDLGRAAIAAAAGERPRERERLVAVGAAAPVESPTVTAGRLARRGVQDDTDVAEAETRVVHDPPAGAARSSPRLSPARWPPGSRSARSSLNSGDEPRRDAAAHPGRDATHGGAVGAGQRRGRGQGRRAPERARRERSAVFVGSFREQRLSLVDPADQQAARARAERRRRGRPTSRRRAARLGRRSRASAGSTGSTRRPAGAWQPITLPLQPTAVTMTSRSVWVGLITDTRRARPARADRPPQRARSRTSSRSRRGSGRWPPATARSGSPAAAARCSCASTRDRSVRAAFPSARTGRSTSRSARGSVWVDLAAATTSSHVDTRAATASPDRRRARPARASPCAGTTSSSPTRTTTRSRGSTRARAGPSASRSAVP